MRKIRFADNIETTLILHLKKGTFWYLGKAYSVLGYEKIALVLSKAPAKNLVAYASKLPEGAQKYGISVDEKGNFETTYEPPAEIVTLYDTINNGDNNTADKVLEFNAKPILKDGYKDIDIVLRARGSLILHSIILSRASEEVAADG